MAISKHSSCDDYYDWILEDDEYTHGPKCMPTKCCGVLKDVQTCLNISTSIPLIISYGAGMNTFFALIYVTYSSLREVKVGKEESDNDKANEAPDVKQEPEHSEREKDNGDSNEMRESEIIEDTDDIKPRQESKHSKFNLQTTTVALTKLNRTRGDAEENAFKVATTRESPSKVENTKSKKSVKKQRYDWEALV